jgi:hypothetical protein
MGKENKPPEPNPRMKPMSWEWIKNHPFVGVIAACAVAVGTTFGVAQYWFQQKETLLLSKYDAKVEYLHVDSQTKIEKLSQKYEKEINRLESLISSIERRIGDNKYFDIKSFFIKDPQKVQLSERSEFHDKDEFYASLDKSRWKYTVTTHREFWTYLLGENNPFIRSMNSNKSKNLERTINLWKGINELYVESNAPFQRLFPYIFVQRIEYKEFLESTDKLGEERVKNLIELNFKNESEEFKKSTKDFILDNLKVIYRGDAIGIMLNETVSLNMATRLFYPNTTYDLKNIQKVGNVFYIQSLYSIRDIILSGKKYSSYYITQEYIMISTLKYLYIVGTGIPSAEPAARHEYFNWINEWLGDFAILLQY